MNKPQLIIDAVGNTPKVTIVLSEGKIQAVVKKACPNVEVEIHDYDFLEKDEPVSVDPQGKSYKIISI